MSQQQYIGSLLLMIATIKDRKMNLQCVLLIQRMQMLPGIFLFIVLFELLAEK